MDNLAIKWHDIDVSFLKEKDDVMVNLTDMAKGFPKKNLAVIMNSKEMREYIQAIKRRYESRKSEIQNLISLNEERKSETQICRSLNEDQRSEIRNIILPDSQSVTNGETRIRNIILPDFQPVRVVKGGKYAVLKIIAKKNETFEA